MRYELDTKRYSNVKGNAGVCTGAALATQQTAPRGGNKARAAAVRASARPTSLFFCPTFPVLSEPPYVPT